MLKNKAKEGSHLRAILTQSEIFLGKAISHESLLMAARAFQQSRNKPYCFRTNAGRVESGDSPRDSKALQDFYFHHWGYVRYKSEIGGDSSHGLKGKTQDGDIHQGLLLMGY